MSGRLFAGLLSITIASCSPAGQSHRDTSSRGDTHRTLASSPPQQAEAIDGFRRQLGERNDKQTRIHVLPIGEGNTAVILELKGEGRPIVWIHNNTSLTTSIPSIKREQQVKDYLSSTFVYKDKYRTSYRLSGAFYSVTGQHPHIQKSLQTLSTKMLPYFPGTIWSVMQEKIHSKTRSGLTGKRRYWQARHEEYALRTSSSFKFYTWSASPLRSLADPLAAYDLLLMQQDSTACLLLVPDPLMLGDTRRQCGNQIELSENTFRLTLRNRPTIEFPVSSSISVVDLGTSVESSRPVLHQLPLP